MTTPETSFSYNDPSGIFFSMTYAKPLVESGRLKLSFSSPKIKGGDGAPKVFSLQFNAIGDEDPLGFLEQLDEGYLNDKVTGLAGKKPDLFATIQNVRTLMDEAVMDLSVEDVRKISEAIDGAGCFFDGDHTAASVSLIRSLVRTEITCFADDPGHLVGHRMSAENVAFHREVWPDVMRSMERFLTLHPDVDERIDDVRKGVLPEALEMDDDGGLTP